MSSLRISESDLSLASPRSDSISYPIIASVFLHALIGFLVYAFLPAPLVSILSAPAKTISVMISPAIPEVIEEVPTPPKPIVKPKPIIKPKPIVKKNIVTTVESSVAVQQKKPKPIKKPIVKPVIEKKTKAHTNA